MLNEIELIRKLDFFEALDHKIIKNIAQVCIARDFAAGDYIVRRGESGLGLYFITRGRAKVEIDRDGAKATVAELKDGDFLGELSMIDDKARSADVVCLEDTSCLLLTRDSFTKLMNKYPQIALQMARSLVARIRATNERVGATPAQTPTPFAPEPDHQAPIATASAVPNGLSGMGFDRSTILLSTKERAKDAFRMYSSSKNQTKDFLVDLFGSIYFVKMMTRFSTAIMGCPVHVWPEVRRREVLQTTIDGVKLALFPASGNQILRVDAFGDGELSVAVFCPSDCGTAREASVACFEGRIHRNETLRVHVPAKKPTWMEARSQPQEPLPSMAVNVIRPNAFNWNELSFQTIQEKF